MQALQITDIRSFMKNLLTTDTFDHFCTVQGTIVTFNTFQIDGRINPDFFGTDADTDELASLEYTPWSRTRELAYSLIKGKHTPLAFRFTLKADKESQELALADVAPELSKHISALILNIRYDEHGLMLTTATSTDTFIMDRSAEEAWDIYISRFIKDENIN